MKKPKPHAIVIQCSVCDLPWDDHGEDPTLETCIKLLKEKLATATFPRMAPYTKPTYPWQPWYPNIITWSSGGNLKQSDTTHRSYNHPVFGLHPASNGPDQDDDQKDDQQDDQNGDEHATYLPRPKAVEPDGE